MNKTVKEIVAKWSGHPERPNLPERTRKTKRQKTIEERNPSMIVELMAEAVVEEASFLLQDLKDSKRTKKLGVEVSKYLKSRKPVEYLTDRAETIYANNPRFAKKVDSNANHGNAGRDYLMGFMRHWLSADLGEISRKNPDVRRILERSGFSWYGYHPGNRMTI
jgi:hypothetical protein